MQEHIVEAKLDAMNGVLDQIDEYLEEAGCPMKVRMQIRLAAEEIFVNVASYAYTPGTGDVTIRADIRENPRALQLTFIDGGVHYNPLLKEAPDTSLSAEDRQIGGLGIFMARKTMDDMQYRYENGRNILTMLKQF